MDCPDNHFSTDPVISELIECPACRYVSPPGIPFSTCPHCGLIVSKYIEHRQHDRVADPVSAIKQNTCRAAISDSLVGSNRRIILLLVIA